MMKIIKGMTVMTNQEATIWLKNFYQKSNSIQYNPFNNPDSQLEEFSSIEMQMQIATEDFGISLEAAKNAHREMLKQEISFKVFESYHFF